MARVPFLRPAHPMHRPRSLLALALAGAAACASAPRHEPVLRDPMAGAPVVTRVDGLNTSAEIRQVYAADDGAEAPVRAAADRAFLLLPEVYEGVGLRVNTVMSDSRTAGVRDVRAPAQLGRAPLSRYVDCGTGPTGAPHADSYAVVLTTLSRLTPAGDSASSMVTQVAATATPRGTSGMTVRCVSTGRLERLINQSAALRAATRR